MVKNFTDVVVTVVTPIRKEWAGGWGVEERHYLLTVSCINKYRNLWSCKWIDMANRNSKLLLQITHYKSYTY